MESNSKPDSVKILSITPKADTNTVFGLGDDDRVYFWEAADHIWILWA